MSRLFFCVLLVAIGLSLYGAIMGNLLCSLAGLVVGFYYFRKTISSDESMAASRKQGMVRQSLPFLFLPVIFNISMNVNLWLVGVYGNETDLGLYNAAFSFSRVIFVLFSGLTIALFPAAAASLSSRDGARSKRLVEQSLRFLLLPILPVVLYTAVSGDVIISIFGSDYIAGAPQLSLLMVGFFAASFLYLLNDIHMAEGKYLIVIAYNLMAMSVELVFCLLLIPRMGISGSAIAMVIAMTSAVIPMAVSVRKRIGIRLDLMSLGRIVLAAAVSSLPLMLVHSLYTTAATYLLCAAIYLMVLLASGELSVGEIKYWLDIVFHT